MVEFEEQPVFDGNGDVSAGTSDQKSSMVRVPVDERESRKALVSKLADDVRKAKKHHSKVFKRMSEDMEMVRDGRDSQTPKNHYVANIVQRHVQQRTAALYAKNPKAVAKRRERLDFAIWDGDMETIMLAQQNMMLAAQSGMMPSPTDIALMQDYQQGSQRREQLDRIAKTLEILFHYTLQEQIPGFKTQMKQLVRRTVITGVGYVKLGFQREMEQRPEVSSQIADITQRLGHIERLSADLADGEIEQDSPEAEQLMLAMEQLQNEPEVIVREGAIFDFPHSHTIIVDPKCQHLRGFIGAGWVAQEYLMHVNEVKEVYGVDIGKNFTGYKPEKDKSPTRIVGGTKTAADGMVCVWEFYDKKTGLMYTIADGYPDFLSEPSAPNVPIERFFPFFSLTFNDIEDDKEIIPQSDVRLMRDMQKEHNRSRQGLREHRIAARPRYAMPSGAMEDTDKDLLRTGMPHEVLELNGLADGVKINDILGPVPSVGVDPNLYETGYIFEDMQRVVGSDETSFGAANNRTATANAIAEGSRASSTSSSVDELDDMFTELARATGQLLLLEVDQETVNKIVGPGAVWPQMQRQETAEEIYLEVEAGSSGRPNRELEMANMERILPFVVQMPGINPAWLAKTVLTRMDDHLDLTDAIIDGLPSIVASNGLKQQGDGDPESDPNAQGGEGNNNAQRGERSQQGPQAGFRSA
jgi:hypothetical protein